MNAKPVETQRGFTLLELSIVLTIIGVVMGMSAVMGVSVIASARLSSTYQKMKTLDDALMAYRTANDRLPCPADLTITPGSTNYGVEGATPGTCTGGTPAANFSAAGATNTIATAAEGAVPVATLGLPNALMYDGWGNRFRYAVDISMTAPAAFANTGLACTYGAITVNDVNATARTTGAIYALISHGANGHGAYTQNGVVVNASSVNANEQTNCHCNVNGTKTSPTVAYAPTYVQMAPYLDSSNALDDFDDLVSYKERWQMPADWDLAGACQYIYVSDGSNNRVEVFTPLGLFIRGIGSGYNGVSGSIGSSGTGNGQFNFPMGIAVDSSGNIWVADQNNERVEEFNSSGTYQIQLGTTGVASSANGQLNYPQGVTADSSGNIWVADSGNNRIQKFSNSGSFLMGIGAGYNGISGSIGSSGVGNGQFSFPFALALDSSGNIRVVDDNNDRVQEFNSSGIWLQTFPSTGCTGVSPPPVLHLQAPAPGNFGAPTAWAGQRLTAAAMSGWQTPTTPVYRNSITAAVT